MRHKSIYGRQMYPKNLFNIVLIEPEIPNNTGNIGRTCVGALSTLHLVGPIGFSIDDKQLKRAGLDYWGDLTLKYHNSRQAWLKTIENKSRVFLIETCGDKSLFDAQFQAGDTLVFGRETKGIPQDILSEFTGQIYKIPFPGPIRSFNLANCVAMTVGEGLRQLGIAQQIPLNIKENSQVVDSSVL